MQGKYKGDFGAAACSDCEVGKWASSAAVACTACLDSNHETTVGGDGSGADSTSDCKCKRGYTGPDGGASGTCAQCQAGKFKASVGAAACSDCPANTNAAQASDGRTDCHCNAGYEGTIATAQADDNACSQCEAGKYKAAAGLGACDACPLGKFSGAIGQTECAGRCSTGKAGSSTGAQTESAACADCVAGKYADSPGQATCTDCEKDTYSAAVGATQAGTCTACPTNRYSNPGSDAVEDCVACPVGTKTLGPNTCEDCPAGKYQDQAGASECKDCVAGTYQTNTKQADCTSCAAGKKGSSTGGRQTESAACAKCEAGKYQGQTGMAACVVCEQGKFFAGTGAAACSNCPAGRSTASTQSTAASDCKCTAGYYEDAASNTCTKCVAGKYKDQVSDAVTACQSCKPIVASSGKSVYFSPAGSTASTACISSTALWKVKFTLTVNADASDLTGAVKNAILAKFKSKLGELGESVTVVLECSACGWTGDRRHGMERRLLAATPITATAVVQDSATAVTVQGQTADVAAAIQEGSQCVYV